MERVDTRSTLATSLTVIRSRLYHSMRASRQPEHERKFPLHVVCAWLGNSPKIAQRSYLLVTEADFAAAAKDDAGVTTDDKKSQPEQPKIRETKAVRATQKHGTKATPQGSQASRKASQSTTEIKGKITISL